MVSPLNTGDEYTFRLGEYQGGLWYFKGLMQDVGVYNTALGAAQIQALATIPEPSTLALLAAGLIALPAYAWRKRK